MVQSEQPRGPRARDANDAAGTALGQRIKNIRRSRSMTLNDVSEVSGVGSSTISKIENGAISPTYGNLLRLAKGLNVDVAELVSHEAIQPAPGRFSLTRQREGLVHSIGTHDYEMLCTQLTNKRMVPMVARIRARSMNDLSGLNSHSGEEVMFVVSGQVILHTEFYQPMLLNVGDCVYFDSIMGHATLSGTEEEAVVFWVCSADASFDVLSEVSRLAAKSSTEN
ncbi:MAG: XRE family transcriptional regulator [Rhodospirillales bacterium]